MAKIGELGNSGLGQVPPGWRDNASQRTLFQQWPTFPGKGEIGPLEPYGNPAYEGYGYPAAGYGQKRNKVVGLALPKVASPQLSSNGWEDKVPQGTRVTSMGTLNPKSDQYTRAQVAVLNGLGQTTETVPADVAAKREAQGWEIIKEMDRLHGIAKSKQAGKVTSLLQSATGLDTAQKVLKGLVDSYYSTIRPRLLGADGKSTLQAAARKPERNWKAWLDSATVEASRFRDALGDADTYGLFGALKYTSFETAKTVGAGAQAVGQRVIDVADFFTKPWVLGGIAAAGLLVYAFAKGGGSLVKVQERESRF